MCTRLPLAALVTALMAMVQVAGAGVGDTELVSVSTNPNHPYAIYSAGVSADGRFVAFDANDDTFAAGDKNGWSDCLVRDRASGKTLIASRSSSGAQGNGGSQCGALSEDGRYQVFLSYASNLVSNDTNNLPDLFLRNLLTGITERLLAGAGVGTLSTSISADGRYVAFEAPGGTVRLDRVNGTKRTIGGYRPKLSADGRFALYQSRYGRPYVVDMVTGVRTRVDRSWTGMVANVNRSEGWAISRDGRYVLFTSHATNLVPNDTNGYGDAFVRDLQLLTTERVSLRPDGTQIQSNQLTAPSMPSNGRYVAFNTWIDHVIGHLAIDDVCVRDRTTGVVTLVSRRSDGGLANDASLYPMLSAGGNFVIFGSWATNLSPLDPYHEQDVYLRQLRP